MRGLWRGAVVVCLVLAEATPPPPVTSSRLRNNGYSYTASLELFVEGFSSGRNYSNVLVDTASSELLLQCPMNSSYSCKALAAAENTTVGPLSQSCTALLFDSTTRVIFAGCITSDALNLQLRTSPSGTSRLEHPTIRYARRINVTDALLPDWQAAEGVLGLAWPASWTRSNSATDRTLFQQLLLNTTASVLGSGSASQNQIFGLDLREEGDPDGSWMHLGGIDPNFTAIMQWGERQYYRTLQYHKFQMFEPQLCGQDLLAEWAGSWPVLVDTGAACVTLPEEYFTVFESWTPVVNCGAISSSSSSSLGSNLTSHDAYMCYVAPEDAGHLPRLTFSMSQGGALLRLPLSSLLIDLYDNDGNQGLCVLRGDPAINAVDDNDVTLRYRFPYPEIVLGSLALRSLYFAVDLDESSGGRVGLAQKLNGSAYDANSAANDDAATTDLTGCVVAAACTGDEEFNPDRNVCRAPQCHLFYFSDLDPDTQECRFKPGFANTAIVFLSLMLSLEVCLFAIRHRIGFMLARQASSGPPSSLDRLNHLARWSGFDALWGLFCSALLAILDLYIRRSAGGDLGEPAQRRAEAANERTARDPAPAPAQHTRDDADGASAAAEAR